MVAPVIRNDRIPRSVVSVCVTFLVIEAVKLAAFCAAAPAYRASDSFGYWKLGDQVAHGDIWLTENPVAYRTPGYSWILGFFQALCGRHAWFAAIVTQYLSVWLTTALTGWWVLRVTGRPWLAAVALVICVISAARPSHASALMTETLFTLFFTSTLVFLSSPGGMSSLRNIFLTSLLWGITWLLRPVAVALAPAWLAACCLSQCGRSTHLFRQRLMNALITLAVLSMMLEPWVIRNRLLFQRTSLTVFLGRELWLTTFGPGQPSAAPLPETEASHRLQELALRGEPCPIDNSNWIISSRLTAAGLSDAEADELMRVVAQQAIFRNPMRTAARFIWRSIDFWRSVYSRSMTFYDNIPETELLPDENDLRWRQQQCEVFRDKWLNSAWEGRLFGVELTSLAALIGLAGLWLSPMTWRFGAVMTAAILGTALLTAVVEYPSYRYRMILEPAMIVAALSGWDVIVEVIRRGSRSLVEEARISGDSVKSADGSSNSEIPT